MSGGEVMIQLIAQQKSTGSVVTNDRHHGARRMKRRIKPVYGALLLFLGGLLCAAFSQRSTRCSTLMSEQAGEPFLSPREANASPRTPLSVAIHRRHPGCEAFEGSKRVVGQIVRARTVRTQFNMHVYSKARVKDIVSNTIEQAGAWEADDTEKLMSILSGDSVASAPEAAKTGVLVDVGANIGWFTLVALHLGHAVVAFEPFERNAELLCSSVQAVHNYKPRFRLVRLGLDHKERECELFQQMDVNIGDTHSVCDSETKKTFVEKNYQSLGWMNTTTLDDALRSGTFSMIDRVDVMKIDVEGFEPSVFLGGNRFFQSSFAPRYLFVELVSERMGEVQGLHDRGKHRLRSVLLALANYGYEIDEYSKEGKSDLELSASPLEQLESSLDGRTILFRRARSINT